MRKAKVFIYNKLSGFLIESEEGYSFVYDIKYLTGSFAKPVSLTLPLQDKPHVSSTMIAYFDGLIPEGWLLEIAEKSWKLNARDRMGSVIHL